MPRIIRSRAHARRMGGSLAILAVSVLTATSSLLAVAAPPAHALATGRVVVFSHELTRAGVYDNPNGCQPLPVGAHVLVNLTDKDIRIHTDPLCLTLALVVRSGYGSHVSAVGSFSA